MAHWKHIFSGGSDLQIQLYYDRVNRVQASQAEYRDTYEFDLVHHLDFAKRHDLIWGFGARVSPADLPVIVPTYVFTPNQRTDQLYSGFAQDGDLTQNPTGSRSHSARKYFTVPSPAKQSGNPAVDCFGHRQNTSRFGPPLRGQSARPPIWKTRCSKRHSSPLRLSPSTSHPVTEYSHRKPISVMRRVTGSSSIRICRSTSPLSTTITTISKASSPKRPTQLQKTVRPSRFIHSSIETAFTEQPKDSRSRQAGSPQHGGACRVHGHTSIWVCNRARPVQTRAVSPRKITPARDTFSGFSRISTSRPISNSARFSATSVSSAPRTSLATKPPISALPGRRPRISNSPSPGRTCFSLVTWNIVAIPTFSSGLSAAYSPRSPGEDEAWRTCSRFAAYQPHACSSWR